MGIDTQETAREFLKGLEFSKNGCVYVVHDRLRWSFYITDGKLVYASHSIESFERLERHLRGLSREIPDLDDRLRSQLRLIFDDPAPANAKYKVTSEMLCTEYIVILWLVNEGYLSLAIAEKLVQRMIQEVIEIFLCLPDVSLKGIYYEHLLQVTYSHLSISQVLETVEPRLNAWRSLKSKIYSPYQSLYLVSLSPTDLSMSGDISDETFHQLGRILRGFNFCQLGALLGKDPLAIAQQLYPLIADGSILLRDPLEPFDRLPRTYYATSEEEDEEQLLDSFSEVNSQLDKDLTSITQNLRQSAKIWQIACIDDNESILSIISSYLSSYLDSEDFQLTLIPDSMNALVKMTSIHPDLILLDMGMPNVDSYQLCSLIRKTPKLKDIPIVLVTGNKGTLDRTRARIAGATDYLTKPFLQSDLLKMLMRHLM